MSRIADPDAATLEHARRLDWRFLLPEPTLGRVAYLGPEGEGLELALRGAGLITGVAPGAEGEPEAVDVAVVAGAAPALVREGAAAVRSGGWVYAQAGRRPGRRVGDDCAQALLALGFEHVAVHWHWPAFDPCAEIVPLGDLAASRLALGRRQSGPRARVKAGLGRLLLAAGMLDLAVPCASVVGRRPGGTDTEGGTFALAFLAAMRDRVVESGVELGPDPSYLLITPRFATSRHVVWLVAPTGQASPAVAVKAPRLAGDREALAREAHNLGEVHAARAGGFATIPRLLVFEQFHGYPVLVQTALAGRPLAPRWVRRSPEGAVHAIRAWLAELPLAGTEAGWYDRLVDATLRPLATGPDGPLVERTHELLEPLRGEPLPLVFEHGDVSHPNLVELSPGRVGVLDWELAEPRGLPLADLCFALGYVAVARRGARGVEAEVNALDDAFRPPAGWALPIVRAEAERRGIPERLVPGLVLACFARAAARTAARAGTPTRAEGRYGTIWKLLLDYGGAP